MNEFSIYVLGDADSYFYTFNSIAAFIQSNYITFAASMGIMIMMIRTGITFSNANPRTGTNSLLLMITLYAAALYPTTTAHIIDVRQQGQNKIYTKVDNLPFALVFLASSVSTVVIPIAEITENAFGNLENSATRVGLGKQPEMINNFIKVSNFANQESDNFPLSFFKKAFKIYSKECAMSTSYIPDVGLDFFIKPNKDIIEQIDPTTLGIPNSAYTNTTFSDGVVTIQKCTDLYTYLIDKRSSIETILENKFKEINPGIDYNTYKEEIAKGLYEAGIRVNNIDTTLGNYSENLKISMLNYALSRTLEETITDYKYDLPGISSDLIDYSVNKSSYQMQIDGLGNLAWVNKMAPLFIHYSLIFSYGLFLFVIPVAMGMGYENSKKMLTNYGMGIVAIHVGYISSIIGNSISIYYTENSATDLIFETGNNLMAMNSIPSFNTHASEMAAVSGILLLASYTIGTGIILRGEVAAMQGIMNTIGSRFRNEMMNAANDMASKNAYDEVDEKAKTDARRFLNQNGFTAPIGVNEVSYANEIKRGLESMGAGYGFASAGQGNSSFESDYLSGVANKSAAGAVGTATMGANVTMSEAINSGITQGSMEAGNMQGLASMVNNASSIMDGSKKQTMQKLASTATFGDNVSETDVLNSGMVQGSMDAGNTKGLASMVDSANSIMDGSKKQTMQKTASTASFGDYSSETDAIDSGKAMGIQAAGKASGLASSLKQIGGDDLYNAASTTTIAQTKDQVANANALTDKFGKNLDGSTNGMSYDEMANAENESKLAGRVGGAKGYKNLGNNAFDITAENAEYMTESKAKGTQTRLSTLGGVDGAVATDMVNSMLKAVSEKLDIEAKKNPDVGILNSANQLTEAGLAAMAIKPGQDASAMMSQYNIGNNAAELFRTMAQEQNLSPEQLKEKFAPFMNSDGSYKTGQDFWNAVASQKAGVFSGHNSIMFGDGSMFSGGFDKNGSLMGKFSSGISSIEDNSDAKTDLKSTTTGEKEDFYNNQKSIHNTDAKTKNQLENADGNKKEAANRLITRDRVEYEANPKNQLIDATTDGIHKVFEDEEKQEQTSIVAGAVGTAAGVGLGTLALEKMTKDKDGNGIVKKGWDKTREKGANLRNTIFGTTQNKSNNESNDANNTKSNNTTNDKTHGNSFKDIDNYNKKINNTQELMKQEGEKFESLKDKLDNPKSKLSIKEQASLSKKITESESRLSNYATELDELEHGKQNTINSILDNSGNSKNNIHGNNWFTRRIDAFANAMNTNGGVGKKLGLGISALALGSQNETFANVLAATDPTSLLMGQNLGDGMLPTFQNMQQAQAFSISTNNNLQYVKDSNMNAFGNLNLDSMPIASAINSQSSISSPTATALFGSGNMSVDNPLVSNIERSISQDIQTAQSSKEANIELIDTMSSLADLMKKNINKENER